MAVVGQGGNAYGMAVQGKAFVARNGGAVAGKRFGEFEKMPLVNNSTVHIVPKF